MRSHHVLPSKLDTHTLLPVSLKSPQPTGTFPMLTVTRYNNASPMFLALFLATNYFLNRPCVYCSLLLAVLVVALFDFHGDWFVSPWERMQHEKITALNQTEAPASMQESISESASLLTSAISTTAEAVRNLTTGRSGAEKTLERSAWTWFGLGWFREAITRGEVRISCLNMVIRL